MGTYLAIGLVYEINISKSSAEKAELDVNALREKLSEDLYYPTNLYDYVDNGKNHTFAVKDAIVKEDLEPFLNEFYPLLYGDKGKEDYDEVLSKLTAEPNKWLDLAAENGGFLFQLDAYGVSDNIKCGWNNVRVDYKCVRLSAEGKIMMESWGRQFKFLKYTMMHTFKKFAIAGALRLYITG